MARFTRSVDGKDITQRYVRVEDIKHGVDDVGNEVYVALPASSSSVHAERLLSGKAEEQQFGVVDVELVGGLPLACALLQICVVPVDYPEKTLVRDVTQRRGHACACVLFRTLPC